MTSGMDGWVSRGHGSVEVVLEEIPIETYVEHFGRSMGDILKGKFGLPSRVIRSQGLH